MGDITSGPIQGPYGNGHDGSFNFQAYYNSPLGRSQVPDIISLGLGFTNIVGVGNSTSIEANWITRGAEASIIPVFTISESIGLGFDLDATVNFGAASYSGPVHEISRNMLTTNYGNGDLAVWTSGAFAEGVNIGATTATTPMRNNELHISTEINFGAGLPAGPFPANVSGGVRNTWQLWP